MGLISRVSSRTYRKQKLVNIMSTESAAEKAADHLRVPDLRLAQIKFRYENCDAGMEKELLEKQLMEGIERDDMAAWYKYLGEQGVLSIDKKRLTSLETRVNTKLSEFDTKIETAEKEEGDVDVRDAMVDKAEYLAKTGDRVSAIAAFKQIRRKCHMTVGTKLDLVFNQLKLALFYSDGFKEESEDEEKVEAEKKKKEEEKQKKKEEEDKKKGDAKIEDKPKNQEPIMSNPHDVSQNISEAMRLVEEGGDWDRRNRLKVYEAVYNVQIREFGRAAELFLQAVPTFTTYELMSYEKLVSY